MTSRTNKATKGTITSLVQFGVLIILQAVLAPVVLKIAGQEVLGAYAIVMQIIGYGLILDFGLGVALSRFLSQNFSDRDKENEFTKIFNVGRYFILVTNTLLSIFVIILALNIDRFIVGSHSILADARIGLYIFSAWAIIKTPLVLYGHGLLSTQNMAAANIIGLIGVVSRLVLSLFLVFKGFGLTGLVGANVASEFIILLLQKFYFNKLYPTLNLKWQTPNIPRLKEVYSFGMKYWGVNIAIVLTTGSDSIVVGHVYGAAAAAIYYTTKIPSFLIIQIIYKISDNAGPAANELLANGNFDALKSAYLKIVRYSLLLAVPVALGIITFNKGVITTWVGEDQYGGNIMSFALALFVLTQVSNHINAMITLATGNMRNWMIISIAAGLMTLILAYTLSKLFGMQWVMVAIALVDIPVFAFLMNRSLASLSLTFDRVWHEAIFPVVKAASPLFLWVSFVLFTEQVESLKTLMACIAVFVLLWLFGLYTLGITKQERILIKKRISFTRI